MSYTCLSLDKFNGISVKFRGWISSVNRARLVGQIEWMGRGENMEQNFDLGPETTGAEGAAPDTEGMTFNLNDVEEVSSFEVLPKGTYNAIVEEFEFTTSQSSGNPMIKAVYSITDAEYAERKIFDYYLLAGEGAKYSMPRLKQLITRVCPEIDASTFNPSQFADSGVIINRACQLNLGIQTQKKGEYKGEKRNNVKEILAADGGEQSFLG